MEKISTGKFHFEPPFTSFDHLVGERQQLVRDFEAERLGGQECDASARERTTQLRFGLPTKPQPWPAACAAQPPATRPLKIAGPSMVPSRPARPLMWPPAMPATSPAA